MIRKLRSSLQAKVILFTAAILFFMSMLVYFILAGLTPHTYSNTLNQSLDAQVKEFVSRIEQVKMEESGLLFDQFLQNPNVSNLELYSDEGNMIDLPTNQILESGGDYACAVEETAVWGFDNAPVLSNHYFFSFLGSDLVYDLAVYGDAAQIMELRQAFLKILPVLFLLIVVVSAGVSYLFSGLITKPVLKISKISKGMSEMELDWEIEEIHTDELGILEKSLNEMSRKLSSTIHQLDDANKQLEADIENEKRLEQTRIDFFSAVSHELKTPITVIKGQLEGMLLRIGSYQNRDKYLARSLEVANTLEAMVQEILTVSRLESTEKILKERVDLNALIYQYIKEAEDLIVQKELKISLNLPGSMDVEVNRLLMEKVFTNLIGNAIHYSPQNADIYITASQKENSWEISIENTKVHLSDKELPKIFDAFYRVEQSRNRKTGGSGLGLYIVQKILAQYGSVCKVVNTAEGVKFYFSLPL